VVTIHQRLRDERGLAVSVASLRRYLAANLPEEVRRSGGVTYSVSGSMAHFP
jgi:hypothetical protein